MCLVHLNPFQIFPYNKLGVKQCECVRWKSRHGLFVCVFHILWTGTPFPNLDDLLTNQRSANTYLIRFQRCTVRVDLLCLHIKVRRWFGYLTNLGIRYLGHLLSEVSGHVPPGGGPGRTQDTLNMLEISSLSVPPDKLELVARDRQVWDSLLRLLPPQPKHLHFRISGRKWMG